MLLEKEILRTNYQTTLFSKTAIVIEMFLATKPGKQTIIEMSYKPVIWLVV